MTFGLIMAGLFVCCIGVVMLISLQFPWLFERNTPERKLLLAMLRELAHDSWCWQRSGDLWTHAGSGVAFRRGGYVYDCYRLMAGQVIDFGHNSKGARICARIRKAVEKDERRQAELNALEGMTAAFNRMNDAA